MSSHFQTEAVVKTKILAITEVKQVELNRFSIEYLLGSGDYGQGHGVSTSN